MARRSAVRVTCCFRGMGARSDPDVNLRIAKGRQIFNQRGKIWSFLKEELMNYSMKQSEWLKTSNVRTNSSALWGSRKASGRTHFETRRKTSHELDSDTKPNYCGHTAVLYSGGKRNPATNQRKVNGEIFIDDREKNSKSKQHSALCTAELPYPKLTLRRESRVEGYARNMAGLVIDIDRVLRDHIKLFQGVRMLWIRDVSYMLCRMLGQVIPSIKLRKSSRKAFY